MLRQQLADLEQYVIDFPDSPYTPGLHQAMGGLYRGQGRYSKALEHWRTAWAQTKSHGDGDGKKIADGSLAPLSRLLASLGRLEELNALSAEVGNRRLDASYLSVIWRESLEALAVMRNRPGMSYRCGVFALNNVAFTLTGKRVAELSVIESPETGFSLKQLESLAQRNGLRLRAAIRESGTELVVPCVVHWRENHYAALTRSHGDACEVVDPTFGYRQVLENTDISAEASGCFLIPEDRLPAGWRWLTETEASTVFGKGFPYILDSRTDSPCPSSTQAEADGSCVGCAEGTRNPAPESDCCGMPTWWVSEPYLNLWVKDVPLVYQPNKGPRIRLELKLKQRASLPSSRCRTAFGALWQSSWVAYVDGANAMSPACNGQVVLHGRDGETLSFYIASGQSESGVGYFNNGRIRRVSSGGTVLARIFHRASAAAGCKAGWLRWPCSPRRAGCRHTARLGTASAALPASLSLRLATNPCEISGLGFDLLLPGGQEERYRFKAGNINEFFLKEVADAQGQVVTFNYDPITDPTDPEVKLRTVVDADGNTFTLNYNHGTDATLVTSVSSSVAGTASFAYDDNVHLTDLTDTAGIASELTYDGNGCPLTLKTPYGTTGFDIDDNLSGFPIRTALITEADGSQQLYSHFYGAGPNQDPPMPTGTPIDTFEVNANFWRNSFHWGRAQVPLLSTLNIEDITLADVNLARVRHWLGQENEHNNTPAHTLGWEIAPSPDGTLQGQSTWYDYPDKAMTSMQGSQVLPGVVARVMPDSSTWYQYFTRNSLGQVTQSIEKWVSGGVAQYRTNSYTYAANGIDLVQHVGPDGAVEQWSYNGNHQALYHTNALNEVTAYTYNGNGQIATVTSPSGLVATYTYNGTTAALERIVESISGTPISTNTFARYPGQTLVRAGLNGVNLTTTATILVSTDARGLVVTNILDSLGRPWERRSNGLIEASHYELFPGQSYSGSTGGKLILDRTALIRVVGGTNYTTNTWTYDGVRRLAFEGDAAGTLTAWQYCDCGGPSQITRGHGLSLAETTTNAFNVVGWKTNVSFPGFGTMSYTHDLLGRVLTTTDALGTTTNVYDNLGRVIEVKNAFGTVESRTYDVEDRVTQLTDRNGVTTTSAYDALGRVQTRTLTGGVAEKWFYTANVRGPTSYTNQIGKETQWTYDAVGRKTNEVVVGMSFAYNNARLRSQMGIVQPTGNGWTNTYTYDASRRLTGVSSPAGTFGYQFTGPGTLVARLDQPGGFWITNTFDGRGRLTDTTLYDNTSTILNRHGYVLNHAHQRTTITRTNYAASTYNGKVDYTYDNAGEVRTARAYDGSGTAVPSGNFDYGYDAGWNILKRTNNAAVTTYTVNNLNQITGDGGASWGHDNNGNLTWRPRSGGYNLSYTYDDENQLLSVSSANQWKEEFTYDGRGRMRVKKDFTWSGTLWVPNGEVWYVYDGMLIVQERNNSSRPLVTYTRGTDLSGGLDGAGGIGGLLSRGAHATTSPFQLSTAAHYHADGNGNVTMLVGAGSPTIKGYYRYDPFGRTLASGGSLAGVNAMRFSSKPAMGSSDLYCYGYRFYDPSSQRWPNRDPINEPGFKLVTRSRGAFNLDEEKNLYAFVHNNPVNLVDPFGDVAWGWPVVPPPGYPPTFPPRPPQPPAPPTPFESCVVRCLDANGGGWALGALGISTVAGGTVPKPFGAGALGGGCCTTVPSLIQHYTGLGLRQLARRLNPVMTATQCAAAGYLLGATASCAAICAGDNDAY